jgi:hypothetical protein
MDAKEYLKHTSPDEDYGLRAELQKHLLRGMVEKTMEMFYEHKSSIDIPASQIYYDLSIKAMKLLIDKENMSIKDARELPEVKRLYGAMDVIEEFYLTNQS